MIKVKNIKIASAGFTIVPRCAQVKHRTPLTIKYRLSLIMVYFTFTVHKLWHVPPKKKITMDFCLCGANLDLKICCACMPDCLCQTYRIYLLQSKLLRGLIT